MAVDPLAEFYGHTLSVRRAKPSGRYGGAYDVAEDIVGFFDDGTKLVPGPGGVQVVSSGRFAFPLSYAYVPVDSEVTVPVEFGGRTSKVIVASRGDGGGAPTPDHYEISLL